MGDKSIVKKFDAQPSISTIRSALLNFNDCFIIIVFSIEAISTTRSPQGIRSRWRKELMGSGYRRNWLNYECRGYRIASVFESLPKYSSLVLNLPQTDSHALTN